MSQAAICKICERESLQIFKANILKKYSIDYYQCTDCGFAQTDEPFWLAEAYSQSMNLGDTGQMVRTISNAVKVKNIIEQLLKPEGQFLDYAGGYGLFTRTMRDFGFDFYWEDLYTENLIAKGYEKNSLKKFEAITVFECFEHLNNPIAEIEELLRSSDTIIFTTNLIQVPAPKEWWYYGFDHGQHIAFYSKASLEFLAKKFSCRIFSKFGVHILTKRKISNTRLYYAMLKSKITLNIFGLNSNKSLTTKDHLSLIAKHS